MTIQADRERFFLLERKNGATMTYPKEKGVGAAAGAIQTRCGNMIQENHGKLQVLFHRNSVPAWFIVGLTIVLIGHVTGICSLVSIKSRSTGVIRRPVDRQLAPVVALTPENVHAC